MSDLAFIETQFPIARLSAESYRERKAVSGQTLTGLGKWWGRKPLILVRASVLGMLMPASSDPKKDREIFLKLLTMDADGLWRRRKGAIPDRALIAAGPEFEGAWREASKDEKDEIREEIWESLDEATRTKLEGLRRFPLTRAEFDRLSYSEKLKVCVRPEQLDGPDSEAWSEINAHLKTSAFSLSTLVEQLGVHRFGHKPIVGDCFAGGGSIPFEAARIGCEVFGSDLNPVAALLTWASLNLVGGGKDVQKRVKEAQQRAFDAAQAQIDNWGIEHSEEGWRAEAYLYCVEVKPDGCDYAIPLAPNWVVSEKFRVCGVLGRLDGSGQIAIDIVSNADSATWGKAKSGETGTVKDSRVVDPFDNDRTWAIEALRGPEGLRRWVKTDLVPRRGDTFGERLYCIRWRKPDNSRVYRAPTAFDLANEAKTLKILGDHLEDWWEKGSVPSMPIPTSGVETDRLFRERGWTHWHHLFTPRQLLSHGLFALHANGIAELLPSVGRLANWDSRLCQWLTLQGGGIGGGAATFANQALNSLYNFSCRSTLTLRSCLGTTPSTQRPLRGTVELRDARTIDIDADIWITDPPYADAVNYHELADFFLAWYEKVIPRAFPEWAADGRAALAVKGSGEDFKRTMVEVYSNLARHMPGNGLQMVQFTHQNPAVWADLGMILWAAGLRVTAAWTISTETAIGGMKKGNYVSGTVCLVLRRRTSSDDGFLDEVYPLVEDEVRRQIDSMRALDEDGEPNFGDTDYQLAAYAAALRVLTQYQTLDGQDVGHELFRVQTATAGRGRRGAQSEASRFEQVIERGIQIACDYLVPRGLETIWRGLTADERLYLRSLDVESRGERRQGMYQELARGFGVREVRPLLYSDKANSTRVRTPIEFGRTDLEGDGFGGTKLRQLLFAVHTAAIEERPESGMRYLKDELPSYWSDRQRLITILDWLANLGQVGVMSHWSVDSQAARLLSGRLRSDHG